MDTKLCSFERCISIEENKKNAILERKAGHILNLFNIFPALPRRTVSTRGGGVGGGTLIF